METTVNKNGKSYYCGGPGRRIGWVILGIIGFAAFAFLLGFVIMWLWNWLMPVIFHLGVITYWQAVGLAVLFRLFFGSWHHGGPHYRGQRKSGHWKYRYHMNDDKNCRDYYNSERWNYYDQFWNEEGEKAFNEYVKRKNENK